MLRIAAETEGAAYEELADAQMLWVDRLGMYLYIKVLFSPSPSPSPVPHPPWPFRRIPLQPEGGRKGGGGGNGNVSGRIPSFERASEAAEFMCCALW